jgi:hypothetical protein
MSETIAPAAAAPAAVAPAVDPAAPAGGNAAPGAAPVAGADAAAPGTTLLGDAAAPDAAQTPTPAKDGAAPVESTPPEPVVYEDFTLPEGIAKDAPMLDAFKAEASKLGIPQEQAQAIVTAVSERLIADAKAQTEANKTAWDKVNEQWQAEIKADKEIGGARFEAMKTNVGKLFDDYVGPINSPARKALNEALWQTGAGNNPALVRAFAKIAAAHTEGGFVSGTPPRGAVDIAALMYPSMARPNGAG